MHRNGERRGGGRVVRAFGPPPPNCRQGMGSKLCHSCRSWILRAAFRRVVVCLGFFAGPFFFIEWKTRESEETP